MSFVEGQWSIQLVTVYNFGIIARVAEYGKPRNEVFASLVDIRNSVVCHVSLCLEIFLLK